MPSPSPEEIATAFSQPGGYRQIQYLETMIVAPLNHVKEAIVTLQGYSRSKRKQVIRSVNVALAMSYSRCDHFSQQQFLEFAQDVTIWFANEVVEGRAEMEEPKAN